MSNRLSALIAKLGYEYNDPALVELALSHRSIGKHNNERLEFLGDSILNFIVADALFQRFPTAHEGQLSQMRAQLVKGKTLADIGREFSLGDYLNLGPGELKSGGHRRASILADAVEALIGAMYVDGGMAATRDVVLHWLDSRLALIEPAADANKDAKSQLQELLQGRKHPLPAYNLVNTSGSDHQQRFEVQCQVAVLQHSFCGEGSSRRAAEQAAAQLALEALKNAGF